MSSQTAQKARTFQFKPQEWVLLLVTAFWGATFSMTKFGVTQTGPFFFMSLRFGVSALLLLIVFRKQLRNLGAKEWIAGLSLGLIECFSYGSQTYGLVYVASSESAFLTALYVPLVPLMQLLILRRPPSFMNWLGIVLASIGLVLVTTGPHLAHMSLGFGQLLTIFCAVVCAFEITMITFFARWQLNIRAVTVIQLITVTVLMGLSGVVHGDMHPNWNGAFIGVIAFLGLGTGFVLLSLNWAQRAVSATRATLIFTLEPVLAGLIGFFIGEHIGFWTFIGAAFIVVSVAISELKWSPFKRAA